MMQSQGSAYTAVGHVPPASQAATFNAAAWLDVRQFEGEITIEQYVGAVTGSITGSIQDATDNSGTGAAALSGGAFTIVSSANNIQKLVFDARATRGFIRYTGTIVTGPALVSVSVRGKQQVV